MKNFQYFSFPRFPPASGVWFLFIAHSFIYGYAMQLRILVPGPGMNPLQQKHQVLTTEMPGNSPDVRFEMINFYDQEEEMNTSRRKTEEEGMPTISTDAQLGLNTQEDQTWERK